MQFRTTNAITRNPARTRSLRPTLLMAALALWLAAILGPKPVLAAAAGPGTDGTAPPIRFYYNGRPVAISPAPYREGPVIMAPLRPLFAAMGATVTWDPETATALAVREGYTVSVQPGATTALVNGHPVTLPAPAAVRDGVTYLPVRFAAGAFGSLVREDPDGTVVVLDLSHLDLPEDSPGYRLLTRVLAHQSSPEVDLTARLWLGDAPNSPAPLGYGLESRLVAQIRGNEARYRLDQVYQLGGLSLPVQAELYRHGETTYLRTPATGRLVEQPGAGLDQLDLPLGLDPERPWLSPMVGAISGLSLGEEFLLEGEPYRELVLSYDPGGLRALLAGLVPAYGAGTVSIGVESGESRLLVRPGDGWVRRLSQRVNLTLYRVDAVGMPVASPLTLVLEAEWQAAAGPIDWLSPPPERHE